MLVAENTRLSLAHQELKAESAAVRAEMSRLDAEAREERVRCDEALRQVVNDLAELRLAVVLRDRQDELGRNGEIERRAQVRGRRAEDRMAPPHHQGPR